MNKKKRDTLFVYFKISISDLRNKFPEIETLVNSGNPVYLTKNGYALIRWVAAFVFAISVMITTRSLLVYVAA